MPSRSMIISTSLRGDTGIEVGRRPVAFATAFATAAIGTTIALFLLTPYYGAWVDHHSRKTALLGSELWGLLATTGALPTLADWLAHRWAQETLFFRPVDEALEPLGPVEVPRSTEGEGRLVLPVALALACRPASAKQNPTVIFGPACLFAL